MPLSLTSIELPFWIYWICCGLITGILVFNRQFWLGLLEPHSRESAGQGYGWALFLGWITTFATGIAYVLLTQKRVNGPYQLPDLILFSVLNGVLEQGMFIFWFLLGVLMADRLRIRGSSLRFSFGFVSYSLYSGAIHALFWYRFLPDHIPAGPIMIILLLGMSWAWMGLLWRYRAILSMVLMHIVVDLITVGYLHSPL